MTITLPPGSIDPLVIGERSDDESSGAHPRFIERQIAVQLENLNQRNRKVLVALALLALLAFAWMITQSPLLDVDEIEVTGIQTLATGSVVELSEIASGEALLGLDLELAEDRLEIVPQISSATITKDWNGRVTIDVVERVPAVQFRTGDTWLVTAGDGIVLAQASEPRLGVPGVRGALFETSPGRRVPSEVNVSLKVAGAMPTDVAAVVETITQTADSITLDLFGGASIELGDARNLNEKFAAARAFLAHVQLQCVDTINVQAPTVPVIVRSSC